MNPRLVSLTGVFVIGFVAPLVLGAAVLSFLDGREGETRGLAEEVFSSAIQVNGQGIYAKIAHSAELLPRSDRDFLMVAWFNLKRLPSDGKRLVLLSKYASGTLAREGYAVGLERDGTLIRPVVFWGSRGKSGRWYRFAPVSLQARRWFMVALSFYDNRVIGVHIGRRLLTGSTEVVLAGGYDLSGPKLPEGDADLVIGAAPGRAFRGSIGPVGIFVRRHMAGDLRSVLKDLSRHPLSIPPLFDRREVKLWCVDGRRDESQYANQVTIINSAKRAVESRNKALTADRVPVDNGVTKPPARGAKTTQSTAHTKAEKKSGKGKVQPRPTPKAGGKTHGPTKAKQKRQH